VSNGQFVKEERAYHEALRAYDSKQSKDTLDDVLSALRRVKLQRKKAVLTAEVTYG